MPDHAESTRTTSLKELKNDEAGSSPSRAAGPKDATPRDSFISDFCAALENYDPKALQRAALSGTTLSPPEQIAYVTLHWPTAFGAPFSQSLIRKLARERNERLTGDALTTLTGAQRRNRLAALKAFIEAANWIGRDGLPSFEGDYLKVKSELSARGICWPASDAANLLTADSETAERGVERTQFYEDFARSAGFADMLRIFKARAGTPDARPLHPILTRFIDGARPDAWRLYGFLQHVHLAIDAAAREPRIVQDEDDESPFGWPGDTWIDRAYAALHVILEDLGVRDLQRIRVCRNPRCGRYFYARHSSQRSCSITCTNRLKQQILSARRRKTASSSGD